MTTPKPGSALSQIVRYYITHQRPRRRADMRRFRQMPSLAEVIRLAALARRADGKCESHQRRVGIQKLRPFERTLQRKRAAIRQCRSFDELYEIVAAAKKRRIGSLTIYDTAVRIGSFMGLPPKRVYLHAGTLAGARALGVPAGSRTVSKSALPPPLRRLRADEIEDCLCHYGKLAQRERAVGGNACAVLLKQAPRE